MTDEELRQRIEALEREFQSLKNDDGDGSSVSRRTMLGMLAAGGVGAAAMGGSETAQAKDFANAGSGKIGTASNPAAEVNAEQGNFEAIDTGQINSIVAVQDGDAPQSKVDDAGVGGTVIWSSGTYSLSNPTTPHDNQTWIIGNGTEIRPSGDNTVLDFTGVSNFTLTGTLYISDPNGNQTSVAAVKLDNTSRCEFGNWRLEDVHRGIVTDSVTGSVGRNNWSSITINGNIDRGATINGQFHDNDIDRLDISSTNPSTSETGLVWDTSGQDGGNVIDKLRVLSMGLDGVGIVAGETELKINTLLTDSNKRKGIVIERGRLSIGRLWAGANDNRGIEIVGTSSNPVEGLQLGRVYARANGDQGFVSTGYLHDFEIDSIITENNANLGFNLGGTEALRGTVGYLRSYANAGTSPNVRGDAASNVDIQTAHVDDGIDRSDFTTVDGAGVEAAGAGNPPTASNYRIGQIVENADDQTYYIKSSDGTMDAL